MSVLRRLWHASIWHPDAIPADEWKWRHEKRLTLPLLDVILICAGLWATAYGSPLLNKLYGHGVVDLAGMGLAFVATVCLAGVAFPSMWLAELIGKTLMIFLLTTYAVAVAFFQPNPDPASGFVAFIVVAMLLKPIDRLLGLVAERTDRENDREADANEGEADV